MNLEKKRFLESCEIWQHKLAPSDLNDLVVIDELDKILCYQIIISTPRPHPDQNPSDQSQNLTRWKQELHNGRWVF